MREQPYRPPHQQVSHRTIDRNTWRKWSFYVNIAVFIIIALAIYLLMVDVYNAGKYSALGFAGDALSQAWLIVARDVALLAISFTYVFFQLFNYQRTIIRRSW